MEFVADQIYQVRGVEKHVYHLLRCKTHHDQCQSQFFSHMVFIILIVMVLLHQIEKVQDSQNILVTYDDLD